jgi:glycosyltransferase involved in cell wall biosynthesis
MRALEPAPQPAIGGSRARVAHVTSVHDALDGRIFSRECRTLARAGYDVVIVAPADTSIARNHRADSAVDGVQIRTVGTPRNRIERLFVTGSRVIRAALRERADIYHLHDPELLPGGLLLRLLGKRVIYDAHEDVPKDVADKRYIPRPLRRPLARLAGIVSQACTRAFNATVIAVPSIARSVSGRRVVVHNYPVLDDLVRTPAKRWGSRSRAAIYAGFISERRGLYEMIAAMSSSTLPADARLTLVGRFDDDAQRDRAESIAGWDRVDLVGWKDEPALWRLMADAKIGIVTLHPTPAFLDSMPMKLFEYMALGLPVVASDFPAWRAIVESSRCGLLVDPLEPRAIGDSISYLLSHPDEAEAMGRNGRQAVASRFAWGGEGERLVALYADLCSRP